MFKVKFYQHVFEEDQYIVADYYTSYDRFITFYTREQSEDHALGYGVSPVAESYSMKADAAVAVASFAGECVFSVTKINDQPFHNDQTGDTGEDI